MEEWQIGIGLIYRLRQVINLKYLQLGRGSKTLKWLMGISAIDDKYCEIL